MKTSLVAAGCLALSSLLTPSAFADPVAELQSALHNFLNQPSYSWGSAPTTRGTPEEPRGQHEKGGFSKIYLAAGPHIPREEMPAAKPRAGITDDEAYSSERWVFETPDGWKSLQELPVTLPASMMARPAALAHLPPGSVGTPVISSRSNRSFGTRRPDHEVAILVQHLGLVEAVGPGVYRADLTAEGAEQLMSSPPPANSRAPQPRVDGARADVRFWVKDGLLIRYEIAVAGTRVLPNGAVNPISYKISRELSAFGTTVVEVPAEVRAKLRR